MWVRFESSAVRWGSRSCLLGLPPPLLWRAGRGLLSFPCLDRVRVVVAPRGRMFPLGVFGYLPFIYGLAAAGAVACGSGTRPSWGVVAGRGGVGCVCGVGMPLWLCLVGAAAGVSLYFSAVLFAWEACVLVCVRLALRVAACACCAPCFGCGILLRALPCARLAVCLSAVSCSVACCWFVAVCFVCRLLCGVRFVSAPAPTVTWFMQVCAGVHLTATVVVVYRLPCNGRFWQFAARFCVPGCSR